MQSVLTNRDNLDDTAKHQPFQVSHSATHKAVLIALFFLSISLATFSILLLSNHNRSIQWDKRDAPRGNDGKAILPDTKSTEHALIFSAEMNNIPRQQFKKSDKDLIPGRYLSSSDEPETSQYEKFTIIPKSTRCSESRILITIKSSGDHFEHRSAIRESWASADMGGVEVIFLLGRAQSTEINSRIAAEAASFDDIVQGDYTDTYSNLTLKSLNGMEYRWQHCAEPEYVLSVDDDTFVSVLDLKTHLDRLPSKDFVECSERTVVNGKVWRQGRWAVPSDVYPSDKYPTYCNGPCYLMPRSTAAELRRQSQSTRHDLQADDAVITGILRAKAEIPLIQYTRTGAPGWCKELNNRKPKLPKRMRREFERSRRL